MGVCLNIDLNPGAVGEETMPRAPTMEGLICALHRNLGFPYTRAIPSWLEGTMIELNSQFCETIRKKKCFILYH